MEIIVVDGESGDRTRDVVQNFSLNGIALRLVSNPKRVRSAGLNVGIKEAKGDIIMRIDARTRIPPDYVAKCVETMVRTGADNVGGVVKPLSEAPTQESIGLAMSHPFGVGNAQFRLGRKSGFVDTLYPGCLRKQVFDKVGLFDEDAPVISEDSDMNQRIREAGGMVYLNTDIAVYYQPRESFTDLWKLYFLYGGARAGNLLKHKKLTSWRQLVPPAFVAALLGLAVLSIVSSWFLVVLLALLGTYAATDLAASGYVALTNKKVKLLGRLFIAFPCMHVAWALGFFRRLLQRPKPGQYWGY